MANLNDLTKDIEKGKNLEMNLSHYSNEMMSLYYRYSYIKLAYNYYTISEMKEDGSFSLEAGSVLSRVSDIVENGILKVLSGPEREKKVTAIDKIRKDIIASMKVVTAYTDCLQIYEYILNRLESGSNDNILPEGYSDDLFIAELLQNVFSDKDNTVVNSKITSMIGQLPVRITRQKYFELIGNAFSLYNDSDKGSIDDFVYMLRSISMLDRPEGFGEKFPDIYSLISELMDCDYDALSKQQVKDYLDKLSFTADLLYNLSDQFLCIEEAVNDIYVILLAEPYAVCDCNEIDACRLLLGSDAGATDEMLSALQKLEGIQERLYERFSQYDFIIDSKDKYRNIIESTMLTTAYNVLTIISKLESTSSFIELDKEKASDICETGYADKQRDSFIAELMELFKGKSRRFVRSIMASTMAALPLFIGNQNELEAYIRHSLSNCSDIAEKAASVKLLRTILDNYNMDIK